jgi:hypothetical protein
MASHGGLIYPMRKYREFGHSGLDPEPGLFIEKNT